MGERVTSELDAESIAATRAANDLARKWRLENREAIEAYNRLIEADGFVFSDGVRAF
jgi:post-segregation antitoxin (ccd killing protein)